MREAAKHRRWVHAHAHSAGSIKAAVNAGVRSLHSGEFADEEALLALRARDVPLAVTIAWLHARCLPGYVLARDNPAFVAAARRAFVAAAQVLRRARELGVPVAIGTDAAHRFHHVADGVLELEYLQALGYPPLEVLRAATSIAARALGLEAAVGTLEPGKRGDLLLVDGDPSVDVGLLRDKRRILGILKAGEEQPRRAPAEPASHFDVREALAREGVGALPAGRRDPN